MPQLEIMARCILNKPSLEMLLIILDNLSIAFGRKELKVYIEYKLDTLPELTIHINNIFLSYDKNTIQQALDLHFMALKGHDRPAATTGWSRLLDNLLSK